MALKEQLFEDLKSAMKEKDTIRKDTVQLIRSGILQIEKDNKVELDDKGVIEVIATIKEPKGFFARLYKKWSSGFGR